MKTFIFSYVVSLGALVAAFYPDVMARPFHILPRLAFYMAFPMAVLLGMGLIVLWTLLGFGSYERHASALSGHRAAEHERYRKSA